MLISPNQHDWGGHCCQHCDCSFKGTEVEVFLVSDLISWGFVVVALHPCYSSSLFYDRPAREMRNTYLYSFGCKRQLHILSLLLRWGRSCWPQMCQRISHPHSTHEGQNATNRRVPQPLCQRRLAVTLLPAAFTLMPGICVYTYPEGLASSWNDPLKLHRSFTHVETCILGIVSQLFVWTFVQSLWFETKLWAKKKGSRDTRHFHSHYTVTHPLPVSQHSTTL